MFIPREFACEKPKRLGEWVVTYRVNKLRLLCLSFSSGLEATILIFYFRSGRTAIQMCQLSTFFNDLSNDVSHAIVSIHSLRQKSEGTGDHPLGRLTQKSLVFTGLLEPFKTSATYTVDEC